MVETSKKNIYFYAWLIWSLGALFYCYEYFLRISPNVFTGDLMSTYGLGGAALGNLIAFYYYAYTPMQLPVGILMDRYGPRLLLTLASLGCALGSFLFVATNIIWVAALGRFVVGLSSAFAFVGVLKLASIWLPADRFGFIAGFTTTLGMVGAMIGQNILVILVNHMGWRMTTYISAVVGIILAVIIWAIVRNANSEVKKKVPYEPIHFFEIFKNLKKALSHRQIWLAGLVGCCYYIPTSVFAELWGVPYFEQARGFSEQEAAFVVSMIFLGWAVGGPIVGWLSDRLHLRKLPVIIGGFIAAILIAFILLLPAITVTVSAIAFFVFGAASSAENITFAIARESSDPKIAGTSVAVNNMLVMLGGMVLQPVVGKLLDSRWQGAVLEGHRVFSNADYVHALIVLPIGLALGAILTFFIRETYAKAS
jgi:MFS family permease